MSAQQRAANLCNEAQQAIHDEDFARAHALLAQAIALDENFFPALLLQSRLALIEESYEDALALADEAHAAAGNFRQDQPAALLHVHTCRGIALLELGRFHESVLVLREARLHAERARAAHGTTLPDTDNIPALLTPASLDIPLADALAFSGRDAEAIDLLNSALLISNDPDAHLRLARLAERRGDLHQAAHHWRAAGDEYAPMADPDERARLAAFDLAQSHELRELDLDASNFDPEEFDAKLEFPFSELEARAPAPVISPTGRAILNAEAAAALDPRSYYPLTLLSEICDFLHLPLQRLSYAERAAELAASRLADAPPRDEDEAETLITTLLGAVVAFTETSRHEDALIYSSTAHHAYPDHLAAALIHASTLAALRLHTEAEAVLRAAALHHPEDARLMGQLGENLHEQGRSSEASSVIRRAEELAHEPLDFLWVAVYYGRLSRWRDAARVSYLAAVAAGSIPVLRDSDYEQYAEECAARVEQSPNNPEARARLLAVLALPAYFARREEAHALFLSILFPDDLREQTTLIDLAGSELEDRLVNSSGQSAEESP